MTAANGCDPCQGVIDSPVGGESFSVVYADAAGNNYLDGTYRIDNVNIFVDSTGGRRGMPRFVRVRDDLSDGLFGPFFYTQDYTDPATRRFLYSRLADRDLELDYYFQRDTFGIDTFSIRARLASSDCAYFWEYLHYLRNGDTLREYDGLREASITIVE